MMSNVQGAGRPSAAVKMRNALPSNRASPSQLGNQTKPFESTTIRAGVDATPSVGANTRIGSCSATARPGAISRRMHRIRAAWLCERRSDRRKKPFFDRTFMPDATSPPSLEWLRAMPLAYARHALTASVGHEVAIGGPVARRKSRFIVLFVMLCLQALIHSASLPPRTLSFVARREFVAGVHP